MPPVLSPGRSRLPRTDSVFHFSAWLPISQDILAPLYYLINLRAHFNTEVPLPESTPDIWVDPPPPGAPSDPVHIAITDDYITVFEISVSLIVPPAWVQSHISSLCNLRPWDSTRHKHGLIKCYLTVIENIFFIFKKYVIWTKPWEMAPPSRCPSPSHQLKQKRPLKGFFVGRYGRVIRGNHYSSLRLVPLA